MSDKARIIALQAQLRIARGALEKIRHGHSGCPERDAENALDQMWKHDPKQPLQGLVKHGRAI